MNKINNILNSQSCSTFKKNENVEKPTEPSSVKPISNSKYISSDASSACRAYALAHINKSNYEHKYLNGIQNKTFKRMDGAGNKDGKVTVNEALDDLNIANLLSGQNEADAAKIKAAAEKIPEVLAKYAGEDGELQQKNGLIS